MGAAATRSRASAITDTSATISEMPAGQRASKCMGVVWAGNTRLPLFDEDCPKPAWSTLASAPWVSQPQTNKIRGGVTAPWVHDEQEQQPLGRELPPLTRDTDTPELPPWSSSGLPWPQPAELVAPFKDASTLGPRPSSTQRGLRTPRQATPGGASLSM